MFINFSKAAHRRNAIFALLFCSALMVLSILLIPETMPSPSSAEAGVVPTPSLTFSGSHSLSLTVNPGQFGTSDTQNLVVETTNYSGYTMTIAPSSGNSTDLVNSADSNVTLPTITSNTITASSFNYLSTAGYALSTDNGANYKKVTNGGQLYTTNAATDSTTGGMTLMLGAKSIASTPAGDYTKTFTLTTLANDTVYYSITYDKNTEDTVTNLPDPTSGTMSGTSFTLSGTTPSRTNFRFVEWNTQPDGNGTSYAPSSTYVLDPETQNSITLHAIWEKVCPGICYNGNNDDGTGTMPDQTVPDLFSAQITLRGNNFSRTGYGFAGWSEDENAYIHLTDNDGANDPTIYGPMETVTMPGYALKLYAVWVPAEMETINNVETPVYLQGWTGCNGLDPNEVIALTDSRDNSVYAIARLVDNVSNPTYSQCWMIENLRLDVTNQSITYTNANTNHPASSFLYQKNAFTSGNPTWQTCTTNSIVCDDQLSYNLANISRTNTASYSANNQTSSWYSYGGMYNWFTATAGNGLYGMTSGSTAGDICPNGWHLPTGGITTTTDYKSLNGAINSNSISISTGLRSYPANFLYSGYYGGSIAYNRGAHGYYWSSTAYNSDKGNSLSFYNSNVIPGTNDYNKYSGQAVRCLVGNTSYHIVYNSNNGTGYSDSQLLATTPDGNTEYTLTSSNFKKDGYGFAGWSTVQLDPTSNTFASDLNTAVTNNQVYGPNAQIKPSTSDFNSNLDLTLYAIWIPVAKDSNNNDLTFQTTNLLTTTLSDNSTLDSKSDGYVTALKDIRDNEVYAVAKLADGNYWMIENMRLDLSSNNTTINTSNTNHPTQAFVTDINNNYKGKANDPNTTLWKTCTDQTSACYDQTSFVINNLNRESVTPITTTPGYNYQDYGWRSYGVYYNWYTATGGTGTYSKSSGVTDGDICPAGWHLPQGGSGTGTRGGNTSGGFYYLARIINGNTSFSNATTSANIRKYPNNFLYSGYYNGSKVELRNSRGFFWSSTVGNIDNGGAFSLDFNSGSIVLPGTGNIGKRTGLPVRCLINGIETFTLTYNANGGSGAPASDPGGQSNTRSYDFTISSTTPTRSGLTFAGWSTDQNATEESTLYSPGSIFTAYQPGTTTLYAVWVPEVIIHFDPSGGIGTMADQGVPSGTSRNLRPNTFRKSGYTFVGWTTTQNSTVVEYANSVSYTAPTVTGPNPLEITLYAVWGRSRSITYNINTTDATANGTMDNQTGIYEFDQATLWASNFARPNYGFAGWSEDSAAQPGGSSTIYGPNETITVPGYNNSSTLTLYAVWVAKDTTYNLQTFASNNRCSTLSTGDVIALEDSRDGSVYTVGKLADGNCWMMEDLRLDPAGKTLNNTNTNSPDSAFATTVSGLQSSSFKTCKSYSSACLDQYSVGLGNLTSSNNHRTSDSQSYRWYSYGAMYNWHTATMGYGTYSMSSGNTSGDICPSGWHLPQGGSGTGTRGGDTTGGFYYLNRMLNGGSNVTNATASKKLRAYPNNFVYSGNYNGTSASGRGSAGNYWSSTAESNDHSYALYVGSSYTYPGTDYGSKYYGRAVRCIASNSYNLTVSYGTGVASVLIDNNPVSNGQSVALKEGTSHTIDMTFNSGYEFDNWAVSDATIGSTSTQSTTLVMDNRNATLTANAIITTFDRAFAAANKTKQNGYYTMQDMNANICDAVATGQTSSLIDTRDNTVYTVAKLTDNKCWMTKNMRLDFSNSTLTSKTVAQLESMTNNPMTGFFSDAISTGYATASTDFDTDHFFVVKYNKSNIGNTTTDSTGHTYDEYGVYYNWYTATAGRDTQNGLSSGDAAGDICPTGWHLPKGTNSGEFFALNTAINSGSTSSPSGLLASPASFLYSGYYYNSTAYGHDSEGCYWSSTVYNVGQQADVLCFDSSSVYPGTDYYGMHSGFAVRCVSDAAASNNSNNNSNNNNSQQNSQQQNAEPQATPSAAPAAQSMSLSAPASSEPTSVEPTDAEDQTEEEEDSKATSTVPLGVRRSSEDKTNATETVASVSSGTMDESDVFGLVAVVGAGVATTSGLLLLAGKRRKDEEEEEGKTGEGKST